MCESWTLRHSENVKEFEAEYTPYSFNEQEVPDQPDYVLISTGKSNAHLKLKRRMTGSGCVIFVNPKTKGTIDGESIKIIECDKLTYQIYLIRNDKAQQLAFFGLLIASIGLIIDAAFDLGKIFTLFPYYGGKFVFVMKLISWVLKIWGLYLVFKKGLIGSK